MGEVQELLRTPTEVDGPTNEAAQLTPDLSVPQEELYDPLKEPSRLLRLHPNSFSLAIAQALLENPRRRVDSSGFTQFFWENPENVDTAEWRKRHDLICLGICVGGFTLALDRRIEGGNAADLRTVSVSNTAISLYVNQKPGVPIQAGGEQELEFARALEQSARVFGIDNLPLPEKPSDPS